MKFKVGDIVKLVSKKYPDDPCNPIWGGREGMMKGRIIRLANVIEVLWENGIKNTYSKEDLDFVIQKKLKDMNLNEKSYHKMMHKKYNSHKSL